MVINNVAGGIVRKSSFNDCGHKEYIYQNGHNGRQQKDALFFATRGGGRFEDNLSTYTDEYTNRTPYGNGGVGCYNKIDNTAPLIIRRNIFINVSTGTLGSNNCDDVIFEDNHLSQELSKTGYVGGEFAFDIVNSSSNITINNNTVVDYTLGVGVLSKANTVGSCVHDINVTNNIFNVPFSNRGFLLCQSGNNTRGFLILDGHVEKTTPTSEGDFYFDNNTIIPTDGGVDPSPRV